MPAQFRTHSALAALENLANLSRTKGIAALPSSATIDDKRVLFAGHSMGGHGAWAAAVHAASRTIGVASVSGWLKKETYGDSNFLFHQSVNDVSSSYVEPQLEGILTSSIGENNLELHLPLIRNVPHLARVGDADKTVHAFWARRAVRLLANADPPSQQAGDASASKLPISRLSELPGKEHWWWDTSRPNDGGALNDEEMRSFFASVAGEANTRPALPAMPDGFVLMAHGVGAYEGRGGWKIAQAHVPARMASVQLNTNISNISSSGVLNIVTTRNVRRLTVPREAFKTRGAILIDEEEVRTTFVKGDEVESVELCRLTFQRKWKVCGKGTWEEGERGPDTAGPLRQAMQKPFAIVVGSGSGDATEAKELEHLAVYLANLFVLTSDASPVVLPDVAVAPDIADKAGVDPENWVDTDDKNYGWSQPAMGGRNLILIGGPRENEATRALARYWHKVEHHVEWTGFGELIIGGCELPISAGRGALILGPLPGNGLALVIDGDATGKRAAVALGEPTIPPMARTPFSNTLPDYIVTGPEFEAKGYGGVIAAGYFNYKWRVWRAASFLSSDCLRVE